MQKCNMSPALVARLKNNTSQTTNIAQSTSIKDDNRGDSFVKRNKKAIVATSIVGSIVLAATTVWAYLRGKAVNAFDGKETKFVTNLKEGFKSFFGKNKENYNLNIKKKNIEIDTKTTPNKSPNVDQNASIKPNRIDYSFDPSQNKLTQDKHYGTAYKITPASLDETSIENDLKLWAKKAQEAPQFKENGKRLNCLDVEYLQNLKPHTYEETSTIYINPRRYYHGFPSKLLGIVDGKFGPLENVDARYSGFLQELAGEKSGQLSVNEYVKGYTKDGRAFVKGMISTGNQDEAGRYSIAEIILESNTDKFNQDQLDFIKVLDINKGKSRTESALLGSSFMEEYDCKSECADCPLFFNKNAFLSIIQNEANK